MRSTVLDSDLLTHLNEPAAVGGRAGVTRYLLDLYQRRDDLQRAFPDLDGDDGRALVEWAHVYGRNEVPIFDELLPPVPDAIVPELEARAEQAEAASGVAVPDDPRWGINLIGYLRAELGIGEAGRLLVRGLDAARVPLVPLDGTLVPRCRHGHDFASLGIDAAAFEASIVCANPDGLWSVARVLGPEFLTQRHSIGFWWWEVDGPLPIEWHVAEDLLDEVWVGSDHVAGLITSSVSLPVRKVTLPVTVPRPPTATRQELGLPEGFLFLFMFDYHSAFGRKNPLAVVEAFRQAFPPGSGATLAIKTINAHDDPDGSGALQAAAAEHPDVEVIDRYVSAPTKNAMLASCECYVSLHRAEGFGLTLAEAMYLGKPTIATGYSGNLDFMSSDNSHLVGYEMTPIGNCGGIYPPAGIWADPDVEQASHLMRAVFDDPLQARRLGARAAADIRCTHSPSASASSLHSALEPAREHLRSRTRSGVERAEELLQTGPSAPATAGRMRRLTRRFVLRAMRPFTAYQRMLDSELIARLRRVEHLELEVNRTRAELLATLRRQERSLTEGQVGD